MKNGTGPARIQKAGYKIWYEASATIFHKESMSVGKENPMKVYYHTRNRILYMRRNSSLPQLFVFSVFFHVLHDAKSADRLYETAAKSAVPVVPESGGL